MVNISPAVIELTRDVMIDKLAELGFVNGFYGDTPYSLVAVDTHNSDSRLMIVVLDGRQLGFISVTKRGTFMIDLNFSRWLHTAPNSFILSMDIALKADQVVAIKYAKADAKVVMVMLKNRWGETGPV